MCTSILSFAEQTKDSVLADVVGTKKVSFDFEELEISRFLELTDHVSSYNYYLDEDIDHNKLLRLKFKDVPLDEMIHTVLKQEKLNYEVLADKTIHIYKNRKKSITPYITNNYHAINFKECLEKSNFVFETLNATTLNTNEDYDKDHHDGHLHRYSKTAILNNQRMTVDCIPLHANQSILSLNISGHDLAEIVKAKQKIIQQFIKN